MKPQPEISDIDRAALAWFVAEQGQSSDPEDFALWLAKDFRHAEAYAKIEELWGSSAFASAAKRTRPQHGRRAASAAALALCLTLVMGTSLKLSGTALAWPADYSTSVGELAAWTLDDGSKLTLDSGAAVDVTMNADQRDIRLLRGRMFLTVAKDNRPLRVRSGDAIIRDIGTAFSVSRSSDGEHVAVSDGLVEIRAHHSLRTHMLGVGDGATLAKGVINPVYRINQTESFAWTDRHFYFTRQPVSKVVDELRRYHRGWIIIAHDTAGDMPISGGVSLANPADAMEELAQLSGTRLSRVTDRILILR